MMSLPFLSSGARRRDQIVAVDLGGHATKATHLQRRGDGFTLANYVVKSAPTADKDVSPGGLAEHLKAVADELGARTKQIVLALGVNDAILRHAEMPMLPLADMRLMLKYNPKNYLLQDLPNHVFDCHVMPPKPGASLGAEGGKQKYRVLVGGAKQQLVDDLQTAAKLAGLAPELIVPGLIGPLNAFEMAQPQAFASEIVGLVDIGFKNTTITILLNGDLVLSRVVSIGGDRITNGLADAMGISYQEAEGIKVGMATEVQANLEPLLIPLGRELRASIDAFEHQQDKTVNQVFISGGSARSELIVQSLQTELMVPCKSWNPTSFLQLALPPQKLGDVEQVAPQLTVSIGAGMAAF